MVLFDPQGLLALEERNLIISLVLVMLIIVVPTFILTAWIGIKYRSGKKSHHEPDKNYGTLFKLLWWIAPGIIVCVLAFMSFKATHKLDPLKPISNGQKEITIQVVALRWKWLFIYPEQNIASVNFVQFPEKTPVKFNLTADAPMNSFWIPALSGQIYAMAGMGTRISMIADHAGDFQGSAAEINGVGFEGMRFTARASSKEDFDAWVQKTKQEGKPLTLLEYNSLSRPTENNPVVFYSSAEEGLYSKIISKFTTPPEGHSEEHTK